MHNKSIQPTGINRFFGFHSGVIATAADAPR
jgi:hypothetical protein